VPRSRGREPGPGNFGRKKLGQAEDHENDQHVDCGAVGEHAKHAGKQRDEQPGRAFAGDGTGKRSGTDDDDEVGSEPDRSAHAEKIAVGQLGAEHHQGEQQRAEHEPPGRVEQKLAREDEEKPGACDPHNKRIDDEPGVAAGRGEIVRRVDQFRDDDDVLVVVAKEIGEGKSHAALGDQSGNVAPIVRIGKRRPRGDGAPKGQASGDCGDQRGDGQKDGSPRMRRGDKARDGGKRTWRGGHAASYLIYY
jgi:hypothetical protein